MSMSSVANQGNGVDATVTIGFIVVVVWWGCVLVVVAFFYFFHLINWHQKTNWRLQTSQFQ